MVDHIKIHKAVGTWTVRAGGAVLGESSDARYFSVVTKSRTLENVVWSYEDPKPVAEKIRNYLAFHNVEEVTVEQI
jgi:uncharacterized protein (DUF427 family)